MVKFRKPVQFLKSAAAILLIGLVLLLSFAGASAALHKSIHPDAGAADHQCAITLFTKGQVDAANVAPVLALAVALFTVAVLLAETLFLPSADYRFSASRAPPSVGLLHS
jgi:hypothetical protein